MDTEKTANCAGESSPAPDVSALVATLTMCLHWAEKDAALYEATLAPEGMKTAIRHRVNVIRNALSQNAAVEARRNAVASDVLLADIDGLAHELFAVAQLMPNEGIEDAVERIKSVIIDSANAHGDGSAASADTVRRDVGDSGGSK